MVYVLYYFSHLSLFNILFQFHHRNKPKFTSQPPQITNVPSVPWDLVR